MRSVLRLALLALGVYLLATRWDEIGAWVRGMPQNVRAQVQFHGKMCEPSYPTVCIPPPPPVLDCEHIRHRNFKVLGADPHGFDPNHDGIGCEP